MGKMKGTGGSDEPQNPLLQRLNRMRLARARRLAEAGNIEESLAVGALIPISDATKTEYRRIAGQVKQIPRGENVNDFKRGPEGEK